MKELKHWRKIKKQLASADQAFNDSLDAIHETEQALKDARNEMINQSALFEISEGSKKAVDASVKAFEKAKTKHEKAQTDSDIAGKKIALLHDRKEKAWQVYQQALEADVHQKLPAVLKPVLDAIEALEAATDDFNNFRLEYSPVNRLGQRVGNFIPEAPKTLMIRKSNSPLGHEITRHFDSLSDFKQRCENLTQNKQ